MSPARVDNSLSCLQTIQDLINRQNTENFETTMRVYCCEARVIKASIR